MRYLLDTNIVSDLVRRPQGRIAEHVRKVGETQVCTSIIVAAELRYGATKRGSQRLAAQLETILGALEVLPFEAPADAAYGVIRTQLEQAGTPIGGNDLLIAAASACARLHLRHRQRSGVRSYRQPSPRELAEANVRFFWTVGSIPERSGRLPSRLSRAGVRHK